MSERYLLEPWEARRELDWLPKLFPTITAKEIEELSSKVEKGIYYAGQALIEEGEELQFVYLVQRGKVDLLVEAGTNKLSIKGHRGRFILGEVELATGLPAAVRVEAAETCTVFLIERAQFDRLLRRNAGVCYTVLTEACRKVFSRVESYRLPNLDADDQVARILKEFVEMKRYPTKETAPNVVELSVTQDELASRVGLGQATVYRALGVLESKGVVLARKRGRMVLDWTALRRYD